MRNTWFARLIRRDAQERELDRELRFHLDAAIADYMRAGMTREAAERRARLDLGGLEQVKENARDARGTRWIEDWWHDTRYALRGMARSPAFTAAAVLTLAIGIGGNTAVWSILDALMLRSLPVARPEELHAVRKVGLPDGDYIISHPTMLRMRAALDDSTRLAAMSQSFARMYAIVDPNGLPEAVHNVQLVSGNWFSLLGVGASVGRVFSPADDRVVGGHPVVVLGERFWRTRFGGDPAIAGRVIRLNGVSVTIIGVTQAGFGGLTIGTPVDIWAPLTMQHELRYIGNHYSSNADSEKPWVPQAQLHWLTLVARVPQGDSATFARRIDGPFRVALATELAERDSASRAHGMREHVGLEPIGRGFSFVRDTFGDPLRALMVGVALVLLISCANLAGLLLARGASRTHEITVRVSLGARPGRLIRQALTETLTLAAIGGGVGLVVAQWATRALLRLASSSGSAIPLDVPLDGRVLAFALGASLVTGILCGIVPALRFARTQLHESFKTGGRVVNGGSHRLPLGRFLVAAQIALSLILVAAAGLFVQTFRNYASIDPGYEPEQVIGARLDVRAAGYTYEQLPGLYQRILDATRAVPGVRSASLSLNSLAGGGRRTGGFLVPGRELPPGGRAGQVNHVTPDYFATTGIVLLRGRNFTDADREGAPQVCIISETAAKHFFGTVDVVGKRFGYSSTPEFEVIGVVRDVRANFIKERPQRLVFLPLAQTPREYVTSLEARITGAPEAAAVGVRNALASVDRMLPVRDVTPLSIVLQRGLSRERLVARLAAAFGALALLLAGIGLYGVMGYSVARRTNEMGVRLALGATPRAVWWVVLRDSLITVLFGLTLGVALSYPLLGLTRRLVWGLSPHDPATLAGAVALLFVAGALAGMLPAWRAARIDPIEAIRAE